MKYGVDKKLIKQDSVVKLLGNALVLIAPADAATTVDLKPGVDLAGAIGDGKIAVGEVKTGAGRQIARAAFEKLGILKAVEPKFAQTDNVRAALALVARGEAKFGVVYATDAAADPKVKVVATFPADSHEPIVYPFGVTAASHSTDAAGFPELSQDLRRPEAPSPSRLHLVEGLGLRGPCFIGPQQSSLDCVRSPASPSPNFAGIRAGNETRWFYP